MTTRETIDSREAFTAADEAEYNAYLDATDRPMYYDDATECEYEFDYDYASAGADWSDDDEDDGQPDEYTEWQDFMGGDDWDHGQYDDCGGEW